MPVKYKRNTPQLHPGDTIVYARDYVHELTGGIIHMLTSDKYMTLNEIVNASRSYNEKFDGPYDGRFETDHIIVAEYLSLLASVGMILVTVE